MNPAARAGALVIAAVMLGCGGEREPDTASEGAAAPASDVAQAVAVARAVEANPGAADSILAAHGLTRAAFDSLLYVIAADPAKAAAYEDALR